MFRRTPSSVDIRANRHTDPDWFNHRVRGSGGGWQRRRAEIFNDFISDSRGGIDLVSDEWTRMRTFSVLVGRPDPILDITDYIAKMQAIDLPRQERIRRIVDDVIKDKETAKKLKPWYFGWCKRPTFHDEYLPTFNRPNVHLIDTNGNGVDKITNAGPVVAGIEYPVDVLVFSTGFYTPAGDSPATRAHTTILGKKGKSLDEEWRKKVSTFHGITMPGFPNLFFPGPHQSGMSANAVYILDVLSEHITYILSDTIGKSADGTICVEADRDAAEKWSVEVASRAGVYAAIAGCTPGYINGEGTADKPKSTEEKLNAARGAMWVEGFVNTPTPSRLGGTRGRSRD